MPTRFNFILPDEVAETFNGVPDALYQALWESMDSMEPIPNLEDTAPRDPVGFNCLASVWDKFTPEQQENHHVKPCHLMINHGSIFTLRALTKEARDWVTLHLPEDFSGAIEPRYLEPILEGIREEGLTFQ